MRGPERPCEPQAFLEAIDGDAEAYGQMVDLFRETARVQVDRSVAAAQAGCPTELRAALHALAGSLAIVGARPSLRRIEAMQGALVRRDRGELLRLADGFPSEFEAVCAEMDRLREPCARR